MSHAAHRFYLAAAIGAGTEDDPVRPDVPAGTSWVGQRLPDGRYLVACPSDLTAHGCAEVTDPWAYVADATDWRVS